MTDVTRAQLRYLAILRRDGYADDEAGRAAWFRWVRATIGREVTSNKDLTKAEASLLIDAMIAERDT